MNKKLSGALLAASLVISQASFAAVSQKQDPNAMQDKQNPAVMNDHATADQADGNQQNQDSKKADATK